jgi:hypothetical protein
MFTGLSGFKGESGWSGLDRSVCALLLRDDPPLAQLAELPRAVDEEVADFVSGRRFLKGHMALISYLGEALGTLRNGIGAPA